MITNYGVDYVTATAPLHTEADASLEAVFDAIRFDEMSKGFQEKPTRVLGTVGTQVGNMYLGSEGTYRLLRVSGEWANDVCETLSWLGGRPKITRIDFQFTIGRVYDVDDTAKKTANTVREWQKENRQPNHPKPRLIQGFGEGDTFNLGSRSSEVYIRVYDKSREQKMSGPPWYWRYEVELKGDRAIQAFDMYCRSEDRTEFPRQAVESYCTSRGIDLPWIAHDTINFDGLPRQTTDDDKALNWLRTQVRPTVSRLKKRIGVQPIQEALWLDNFDEQE